MIRRIITIPGLLLLAPGSRRNFVPHATHTLITTRAGLTLLIALVALHLTPIPGTGSILEPSRAMATSSGPVDNWPLDEGIANGSWCGGYVDIVGGHTGTPENCNGVLQGVAGNAAYFDGGFRNIDIANSANLVPNSAFTISVWVSPKTNSLDPWGGAGFVLSNGLDVASWTGGGVGLHLTNNNGNQSPRAYFFRPDDTQAVVVGAAMTTGEWHHLAVVFDGTSLRMYQDGSLTGQTTFPSTTVKSGTQDLQVGQSVTCVFGNCDNFFGTIDELKLFDRALSAAEVGALYGAYAPDTTPPVTTATPSGTVGHNGWYTSPVDVSLQATDGGSGVKTTYWQLDGGSQQTGTSVSINGDGTHSLNYWSADNAGNIEAAHLLSVKIDATAPLLDGAPSTTANSAGWYRNDVTIHWTCSDATAGIDGSCPADSTIAGEGTALTAAGSVSDLAGNTTKAMSQAVSIDRTSPTVGVPTLSVNPKGLTETSVLSVPANDALSGVVGGEYFLGADPGQGSGTAMTYTAGTLSATIGTTLSTGVYEIGVRSVDAAGNWSAVATVLLVVYDPTAGYVTGHGTIASPAGAYAPSPSLAGDAQFGFSSKYQKGATAPSGETRFEFKLAGLDFRSTSYQWLVISGARAQYKGTGTINRAGTYGFLLTAIDGQVSGGGGIDRFRIKIWDNTVSSDGSSGVIYDNQMGAPDSSDPATALTSGRIMIHS